MAAFFAAGAYAQQTAGSHEGGISAEMLSKADQIVRIDYGREFRGSLSAASAATVLGFEVLRQNKT